MDNNSRWVTEEEEVGEIVTDYYFNFFIISRSINYDRVFEGIDQKVTDEMNAVLSDITEEEVLAVLI